MILTLGGWQTFILFYLRPRSFKMSIHAPLLVSNMMLDSIPMICTPRIGENWLFFGTCSKSWMSKNIFGQNWNFDQQVLIYCSMASYSAKLFPEKQRTEGGVTVLYWCIVACWFRDSHTVVYNHQLSCFWLFKKCVMQDGKMPKLIEF